MNEKTHQKQELNTFGHCAEHSNSINVKAQGANLGLENSFTASAYNNGTISDLHEIYAN